MDYLQKTNKRIKKFKETGDSKYIYQTNWIKLFFNMAHGDFKDFTRRAASDKLLRHKSFNIAKTPKYDRYQRGLSLHKKP